MTPLKSKIGPFKTLSKGFRDGIESQGDRSELTDSAATVIRISRAGNRERRLLRTARYQRAPRERYLTAGKRFSAKGNLDFSRNISEQAPPPENRAITGRLPAVTTVGKLAGRAIFGAVRAREASPTSVGQRLRRHSLGVGI